MRRRRTPLLLAITLLAALASLIGAASAHAGSYWWSADSSLMTPTNGFHWTGDSRMNFWANRCEGRSGATYNVGTGCSLSWYVPANLDAQGGYWDGTHRSSSGQFRVVRTVEGNGTTVVQSANTAAGYRREWADMASYVRMTFEATANHSVSTGTAQFASMDGFAVVIVDPHSPGLNILEGHGGWKGPGGACIRYGYGEAGSGLQATALQNLNTGAVYDNPGYGSANITTGVFQNDRNCVGIGALPTGHYTFRASAVDKSGNGANNDFTVSFDTTAPNVSPPYVGGAEVTNGRALRGSVEGYRPTFAFDYNDAHSGMAAVAIYLDGAHVSNSHTYTPPSNLALGNHSITFVATDAVGNQASTVRSFSVVDDIAPTIAVSAPAADGSNTPTLDVTASDDFSGVNLATWSVTVNGVQLAVSSNTARLQQAIGRLVNGTHAIEVRVTDHAGNARTRAISHVASTDTRTPPGLNGIYVISPPTVVNEADTIRLLVAVVKAGRPQAGARVDVKRGAAALADSTVAADGFVEIPLRIDDPGNLTVSSPSTGLTAQTVSYQFVPDTTPPALRVDKPTAVGGTSPLLDVTASDTQSGVAPATWAVLANGVELATSSTDARLQLDLGRLANGTHEIEVRISDRRGNQRITKIAYEASGDEFTAPGKTGIFVLTSPVVVDQGFAYRITVISVRDGRPVTAGRYEVVGADGTVVAGKDIGPDGYADILVTDPARGPYSLRLTGSTLTPVPIVYAYRAEGEPAFCTAHPTHNSCGKGASGGGSGGNGWGSGSGSNGSGSGGTSGSTGAGGDTARPGGGTGSTSGTSGGPDDKVAPKFTLRVVATKPGVVKRTRTLVLRMTSNERANYTLHPVGNTRAVKAAMTTKPRVLRIRLTGALLKRIQNAKARVVVVKVRVIGIDPNKNTTRKTITLRIRR